MKPEFGHSFFSGFFFQGRKIPTIITDRALLLFSVVERMNWPGAAADTGVGRRGAMDQKR